MMLTYLICVCLTLPYTSAILSSAVQTLFTNNGWTITEETSNSEVSYKFQHTGLVDSSTYTVGTFPSQGNPNTIERQDYVIYVPKNPTVASSTTCTSLGYVGMSISGATFFNPLNIEGKDAVTGDCAETFDSCQGHPDEQGVYHYHQAPSCVTTGTNEPIGIAIDGFLIYNGNDESGNALSASALDDCGGRTGNDGVYRYHTQSIYPYTIGCFKGSFSNQQTVNTQCKSLASCTNDALKMKFDINVIVMTIVLIFLL